MSTQSNNTGHVVDTHHNKDKVLKESLSLFKDGSLEFWDSELSGEVTEILSTEMTETTTKKAYADNTLKLSTNRGVHHEWEVDISDDDMMRFGSYHLDLSRMHKIQFTTVIITAKKPSVTTYVSPSMNFTPKIINLNDRDADKTLAEIDRKIKAGEHSSINELEIIYLPLYNSPSGKSTADLLDIAIKLTPQVIKDDKQKKSKLHDLLILLTGTFVTDTELNTILEANMRVLEDSPAVRVLEDRGMNKGRLQEKADIALNMLQAGEDYSRISLFTGLDLDRITALDKERQAV